MKTISENYKEIFKLRKEIEQSSQIIILCSLINKYITKKGEFYSICPELVAINYPLQNDNPYSTFNITGKREEFFVFCIELRSMKYEPQNLFISTQILDIQDFEMLIKKIKIQIKKFNEEFEDSLERDNIRFNESFLIGRNYD